jgi:hypothetical protein
MVSGYEYIIATTGTTNFTAYGAASNLAGTRFTATGAAPGTGTVYGAVRFKLYADDVLKHTEIVLNNNPFRLPAGYYANAFQIELSTNGSIQGAAAAHSIDELKET